MLGLGLGKLIYMGLVVLLGALVAHSVKREQHKSTPPEKRPADKPSFVQELIDRLKDPNKPTGR